MANELKGLPVHSAEYFGDTRDHWWREGFLRDAASEWGGKDVRTVLDVGCGVGHWGRLLSRVLPEEVRLEGIDKEPLWITKATEKAAAAGLGERFSYRTGTVESLPFEDGTFDLVTCQTLLMHLQDPDRGLLEMARVTRPGGFVVVAEPTNLLASVRESLVLSDPPELAAALFRLHLTCVRGKMAVGEGNDFVGETVVRVLADAGLQNVQVRLNDKVSPLTPPYESPAERAFAEEILDLADRDLWIWPRETTLRYFLAGGGAEGEFAGLWSAAIDQNRRVAAAVRGRTYTCTGGALFYLSWGRKV